MRTLCSILIFSPVCPVHFSLLWSSSNKPLNKHQSLQTRSGICLTANLQGKTRQAKLTTVVISHFCMHPFLNSFFSHPQSCKMWQFTHAAAPEASVACLLLKLFCVKEELWGTAVLEPPAVTEDAAASIYPCWLSAGGCHPAARLMMQPAFLGFASEGQSLLWIINKDVLTPRQQQN